jgi:hypothetical protein
MKYLVFAEYKPEDIDKIIEKFKQLREERKKTPEKYGITLFPTHRMGGALTGKSFTVVEATEEQIMNITLLYGPVVKFEYVPIFESDKVNELYQKMKK